MIVVVLVVHMNVRRLLSDGFENSADDRGELVNGPDLEANGSNSARGKGLQNQGILPDPPKRVSRPGLCASPTPAARNASRSS